MLLHKRNQKHKPPNILLLKFGNARIQSARPRASATAGIEIRQEDRESCITSAPTGTVGRRPRRAAMPTAWSSTTPGSFRRISTSVRTAFRCVASRDRKKETLAKKKQPSSAERPRPRASATADGAKQKAGRASCITSVSAGSVGRRRRSAPMPTACTSTTAESIRRTLASMRTVFRCVASRKRERGPLGTPTKPADKKAGQPVWPPTPRRGPTLSGRINLFPLPRSSRGGSYFL